MNEISVVNPAPKRKRYTKEFKHKVIAASLQPGASVARVALEHGLNANMLRKWIRLAKNSTTDTTPDLSNRLLMPLQQIKKQIAEENSVAQIYMLQTQVAEEKMDEALEQLHTAMQAENARQKKAAAAGKSDHTDERKHEPVAVPKPIADVSASALLGKVQPGLYLENQQDVDKYLNALRAELELLIKQNRRIRIRG